MAPQFLTSHTHPPDRVSEAIKLINSRLSFSIPLQPTASLDRQHVSCEARCHGVIKFLVYQARALLDQCVQEYRDACTAKNAEPNISKFLQCLQLAQEQTQDRNARRKFDVRHLPTETEASPLKDAQLLAVQRDNSRPVQTSAQDLFEFGDFASHHNFSFPSSQAWSSGSSVSPFSSQGTQPDTANTSFTSVNFSFDRKPELFTGDFKLIHDSDVQSLPTYPRFAIKDGAKYRSADLNCINYDGDTEPEDENDAGGVSFANFASPTNAVLKEEPSNSANTVPKQSCEYEKTEKDSRPTHMEHYLLRELPKRGLFVNDTCQTLDMYQQRVRFECTRIALHSQLPPEYVASQVKPDAQDYEEVWRPASDVSITENLPRLSKVAWQNANTREMQLSGSLQFSDVKGKQLFRLRVAPCEPELKSNRFFRKFGAHRFLRLDVPTEESLPQHLKGSQNREHYRQRLLEWASVPDKTFLGCKWSMIYFHTNDKKTDRVLREDKKTKNSYRAFLFATCGPGLKTISLQDVWNWFMPWKPNGNMSFLKAYSRLQLGFSKTTATFKFNPNQIKFINDTRADGADDPGSFNDPSFDWTSKIEPCAVMNDGCARISFDAAQRIWQCLGKPEGGFPSVFQARIGPAKGIWIVEPPSTRGVECADIWIELSESQVKFKCHDEDRDMSRYDADRLTFEVVNYSRTAEPWKLHLDPLHIMHERGVPRTQFDTIVKSVFETYKNDIFNNLSTPEALKAWMEREFGSTQALSGAAYTSDSWSDHVCRLLDHGFTVNECRHLAKQLQNVIKSYLHRQSTSMRLPLPRSTMVIGIADPCRCLAPDEIFLQFSKPFLEPETDVVYYFLDRVDALVTRHPTLRNSDIQKVKCVWKKELSHVRDVVVFPSTGKCPLAGKLQGGDYDGDTFWVCWEPPLVQGFQNAPAPLSSPVPEDLGISVNRKSLSSFFSTSDPTRKTLDEAFSFHMEPNLLGICTNYLDMMKYSSDPVPQDAIEKFTALHDLLVDSAKNGYTFNFASFARLTSSFELKKLRLTKPMYKRVEDMSQEDVEKWNEEPNQASIGDHLVFNVASGAKNKVVSELQTRFSNVPSEDPDISRIYRDCIEESRNRSCGSTNDEQSSVQRALSKLSADLRPIYSTYNHDTHNESIEDKKQRFATAEARAIKKYKQLSTENLPKHVEIEWTRKPAPFVPTFWECVKASTLYHHYHEKDGFCFAVAGATICYLKAHSRPGSKTIVGQISQNMKMRKIKTKEAEQIELDDEDDEIFPETIEEQPKTQEKSFDDAFSDMVDKFGSSQIVA